jgi:hypothetical protein
MSKLKVGFVGLGDQGAPMAEAIYDAGFELHVWARRPQSFDAISTVKYLRHDSLKSLAVMVDDTCRAAGRPQGRYQPSRQWQPVSDFRGVNIFVSPSYVQCVWPASASAGSIPPVGGIPLQASELQHPVMHCIVPSGRCERMGNSSLTGHTSISIKGKGR